MDKSTIFLQLLEKSSLTIVLFIIITKIKGFKYIFQKENYKLKDLLVISLIFTKGFSKLAHHLKKAAILL